MMQSGKVMPDDRVEQLLLLNSSKLPPGSLEFVSERISGCDESRVVFLLAQLKDPYVALVFSICLGWLGVDRFYIGSAGIGVGKLLTCGGAYIWWLIDCFFIMDATRDKNLEYLLSSI